MIHLCIHTIAVILAVTVAPLGVTPADPPVAEPRPVTHTLHGSTRVDEYGWLREKDDPGVIAHLEAENGYAEERMAHTADLQDALYAEMLGRIKQTDLTVPYRSGPYFYYARSVEGQEYPIHCRKRDTLDADEEIILDVNELASEHAYFRLTSRDVSPDHRYLAYGYDTSGYESVSVSVKDLRTGRTYADVITDTAPWGLTWASDGRTLFYGRTDETKRTNRIYRHDFAATGGARGTPDVLVAREDDVRFNIGVKRTRSDELIVISSGSATTSEASIISAARPTLAPRLVEPRRAGVRYSIDHRPGPDGGWLYIVTDADDAPNFKLMRAPVLTPGAADWETVVAHAGDVFLNGVSVFRDHLVLSERRGGYTALRVRRHADDAEHVIAMSEVACVVRPSTNESFDTGTFRFSYSSLVTPNSVFDYDLETRERTLLKRTEVLGGYEPSNYETSRIWATADDGTKVPVTIVHRRGLERDGDNPCLLYAYGSYGASMDPRFQSNLISLLDRNFVYAIAHVRGGSEMGRHWKEQGRMLQKKNTFTDFIAVAEHLIDQGYTRSDRLAIRGGSAGGLLIGAVINMRPDLFAAAHAAVPFVDVVNTMLDASIPLTTGEYEEWGNPNEKTYYDYMLSYSPYDNVRAQEYPDLLITAGLNDPRVHYWEPAKWAARLRARKTDDGMLLLKTNMGAGHGGASGRYGRLQEIAWEYAFIVDRVGDPSAGVLHPARP